MVKRHESCYLFILVLISLAVRGIYFYQFQDNPYFEFVPKAWDQTVYHEAGRAFAHGNLLAVAPNQTNLFSPLYQYFIGFIYRFLYDGVQMVWIIQFFMGTLSAILVYQIARHYFEPVVGFIAGLLFTLYGGNWFYEGILYREAFITFLGLLSFYLLIRFAQKPTPVLMVLSALALSLLMQSRANNFLMVPVALTYLWLFSLRRHENGGSLLAGYIAILFVTAIPFLVWGYVVRGFWAFYDQSGPDVFLAGNNLSYPGRGYLRTDVYQSYQENGPLATWPVIRFILKTAWEHPWEFVHLYLRKLYYYFNSYEIPNSMNYYVFQEFAPVLKWGIPFALIGSLGLTGSILVWRLQPGTGLLHAWLLVDVLMVLPFCILSRFRLPVVPVLAIFSSYVLWYAWRKARERHWLKLSALAAGVMLLAWVEKTDPLPEGVIRIRDYINVGSAFLDNKHPEDDHRAQVFYKRAWELSRSVNYSQREPEVVAQALAIYHYREGQKAISRKDVRQGITEFERAIYYKYDFAEAHFLYATLLSESNSPQQAFLEALQAVVLSPQSPDAHLILGAIYQDVFNLSMPARYHLKTALESLPGSQSTQPMADDIHARLDRLKISGVDDTVSREQLRSLLRNKLPPLRDIPFNLSIPETFANKSTEDIEHHLILLLQYLTLQPESESGRIFYQLGALYLKKNGMKAAAYVYFKRAWEKGIQSQEVTGQLNNLNIELSARPFI